MGEGSLVTCNYPELDRKAASDASLNFGNKHLRFGSVAKPMCAKKLDDISHTKHSLLGSSIYGVRI